MFRSHTICSSWILVLLALCYSCQTILVQAAQQLPPNFFNRTGCLYVTTTDAGSWWVDVPDQSDWPQTGLLGNPSYDSSSACMTADKTGLVSMNFDLNGNNHFSSMKIELELKSDPKNYLWEVSSATLDIVPINSGLFPVNHLVMNPANGGKIYAPFDRSYSCSSLVLTNSTRGGPSFKITLKRFQLQPFPEPQTRIFATSRDCATWLTLPQIMGFLLVLFMVFTVLFGAYLLLELGSHSSDLRFSKQAGMLMNQAQLDATKAD